MEHEAVDVDWLIGRWRTAFDAAQAALRAGGLPADEVGRRTERLATERSDTVRVLDALAHDRHTKRRLVRLVAAPWQARSLLGLPSDAKACVFDLEGVLIGSAAIHADAWKETFNEFLSSRMDRTGESFALFDVDSDYRQHIHGRPRIEGIHEFLASRGISLLEGSPDDRPGAHTVHGLGNRKKLALLRRLDQRGVRAFEGARLYLELAHDAGLHSAVVSASANTRTILDRARLETLIDGRVDGTTMLAQHLRRQPATDTLFAACTQLGVEPARTVVFETTPDGIAAGRAGHFELVVGVGRGDQADALRARGADLVVADLGEIVEHNLAA
jgi:beta-phosphoglucomutase-like phosphatase (HAD superfamily)